MALTAFKGEDFESVYEALELEILEDAGYAIFSRTAKSETPLGEKA